MSPAFEAEVARYQEMPSARLEDAVYALELIIANAQSKLAAAKKARKNQKAAAKKDKKVVG